MNPKTLTTQEKKAIKLLKEAAKVWPDSLWIFAADDRLFVMRKDEQGKRAVTPFDGIVAGMDQEYIIDEIIIDADGGAW